MTARLYRSALLLVPATLLTPSATTATTVSNGRGDKDQTQISACIRRSASGRGWLEKTLWGLRDQEGGWIGAEIANTDGSFDLGPMQVNSRWVVTFAMLTGRPPEHVRWWLAHDACFNVEAARWIFLSGFAGSRGYWAAIGAYHSPTAWRQRLYASGVAARLQFRFGNDVFSTKEGRR